jgi:hypothetical protein
VSRLREPIAPLLLLVLGAVAVYGFQHALYLEDVDALQRRIDVLKKEERALRVVAGKGEELARGLAELREKIGVVEKILPQSLGLPEFRQAYEPVCNQQGFVITFWQDREERGADVLKGKITVGLGGPPENVPALAARTRRMARLVDWEDLGGDGRVARLTVYAMPRKTAPPAPPCMARSSQVRLWPYTRWVRAKEDELASVCSELAALAGAKAQADEYHALKSHLLEAVAAIEKLRPEGRPAS